jgi:hypothetical protein
VVTAALACSSTDRVTPRHRPPRSLAGPQTQVLRSRRVAPGRRGRGAAWSGLGPDGPSHESSGGRASDGGIRGNTNTIMPNIRTCLSPRAAIAAAILLTPPLIVAQQANPSAINAADDELVQLSPFEVTASEDSGYTTATTLAGTRLSTELRDLGTSLSIYNKTFLNDIGATDNQSLLSYTLATEVGGVYGNYSGTGGGTSPDVNASLNPSSNNRVRGLVSADNTRDLYLSSIPWEGYNIEAVDLQRGPNAILFGQGSPGGVINTRTKQATYRDSNEVTLRFDEYGSARGTVDFNRVLLRDELAIRFAAVGNHSKFQQKQAFDDFNREWFAVRYEPKFLKRGHARTIIKVDAELGDGESNRPRNTPPLDRMTPWFTALDQKLYNVAWMNEGTWTIPGRGDSVQSTTGIGTNPNFQPWIATNFGSNFFAGTLVSFLPGSSTPAMALGVNPVTYLGINNLGVRDGTIGGLAPSQPKGIRGYRDWATATNQPFASLIKDTYITDPNIFDFYNNLLDGDIKREWSNFKTFDASLSQTFFDDQTGFDVGYHSERYTSGGYNPVSQTLHLDYNEIMPDGTNTPTSWYLDGTHNPGAGRAYVQLGNGSGDSTTDRTSLRATAFVTHDFTRDGRRNWITRILGTHTVTAMASRDTFERFSRGWLNSSYTGAYYNNPMFQLSKDTNARDWPDFYPTRIVYLGDSLVGKSLGQNLGLRAPGADPVLPDTFALRYFDSTWAPPPGVNPNDPWLNGVTYQPGVSDASASTQSENPMNYVGWGTRQVQLLHADSDFNRDLLTMSRTWDSRVNKAYAFVWQAKLLDNAIVATGGLRHDKVMNTTTDWRITNSPNRGSSDPAQVIPTVTELGPIERDSRSWGVVAHFSQLPWLSELFKRSPVDISASYNRSANFQTGQIFRDYWGQQLPLPEGKTEDIGVVIATKDGKYSLKVNKFESNVSNNTSTGVQFWNYGNNVGIYAQAWSQFKYNHQVKNNPASPRYGNNVISDLPVPTPEAPNDKWNVDFQPLNGQTLEQAQAQEVAVIAAWDKWLEEMAPLPQLMGQAWGFNWKDDLTETGLAEFRFTSDLVAKGYEIELNAQITDSWRFSLNASRITSVVDNLGQSPAPGGKMTMIDYLLDFDRRLNETVMGDLRIWGGASTSNARENWNGYANGDLKARLAEQGTVVPENRLWHLNAITNYDFHEGRLKGWSIGGAARYQSAATLAYKPVQNPGYISYDLNSPYRDDDELVFDAWVGYRRRFFHEKIDWRVQLNVQNIGVGNELVPVTVQPDGTPALYRINPSQRIFITNTFTF